MLGQGTPVLRRNRSKNPRGCSYQHELMLEAAGATPGRGKDKEMSRLGWFWVLNCLENVCVHKLAAGIRGAQHKEDVKVLEQLQRSHRGWSQAGSWECLGCVETSQRLPGPGGAAGKLGRDSGSGTGRGEMDLN